VSERAPAQRLFAALPVPEGVRAEVAAAIAPVRHRYPQMRWTPPRQWHITIAFIGRTEVPVNDITDVLAGATEDAPAVIRLALSDAGRFGRRVLWLGVDDDPDGSVASLVARAKQRLRGAGLDIDEQALHPHITLARARERRTGRSRERGGSGRVNQALVESIPTVPAAWDADALVLYASEAAGRGEPNRYIVRSSLSLGAGPV
jgi:RNA 2',3'-cyclic 3'-phosphodiesterase